MDLYRQDLDCLTKVTIGIVDLVEGFVHLGHPFAVYRKKFGDGTDLETEYRELRNREPIIGFGGFQTMPFISDPGRSFHGAFAVLDF